MVAFVSFISSPNKRILVYTGQGVRKKEIEGREEDKKSQRLFVNCTAKLYVCFLRLSVRSCQHTSVCV